jgi:formate hydrogenlyase transcriptional activator
MMKDLSESRAQLLLDVAKAAGSHLELSDVLEALAIGLRPIIRFDAIAVVVIEGEYSHVHALYHDGMERKPGESNRSFVARIILDLAPDPKSAEPRGLQPKGFHVAAVAGSLKPYVCNDLQREKRYPIDEMLAQIGVASYASVPLLKHGALLGVVNFVTYQRHTFNDAEVQLLQDVSEVVSIAVSNALAFEEIQALKEQLQAENRVLQDEIVQQSIFEEIVGSSHALRKVLTAIERVAPADSTVLITGETGTGKELIAHAIHRRSQRAGRALVKVNCAALPKELIASELFGHEKGAFTGALQQRIGRFEAANGGTIFLDEIGELTPEIQISLLRVLQEREFERVGSARTIHTDVRVIAATNRDLQREVNEGRFRADLYYRLNVFPIHSPSLKERNDDIPILVDYFISRFAGRMGKQIRQVDRRTLDAMLRYSWPGNIRELQNVIERGVILADNDVFRLEPGTLPEEQPKTLASTLQPPVTSDEQSRIEAVLRETRGKVSGAGGAAARLGVPASTLESRIKALRIDKYQFRGRPL